MSHSGVYIASLTWLDFRNCIRCWPVPTLLTWRGLVDLFFLFCSRLSHFFVFLFITVDDINISICILFCSSNSAVPEFPRTWRGAKTCPTSTLRNGLKKQRRKGWTGPKSLPKSKPALKRATRRKRKKNKRFCDPPSLWFLFSFLFFFFSFLFLWTESRRTRCCAKASTRVWANHMCVQLHVCTLLRSFVQGAQGTHSKWSQDLLVFSYPQWLDFVARDLFILKKLVTDATVQWRGCYRCSGAMERVLQMQRCNGESSNQKCTCDSFFHKIFIGLNVWN